MPTIPQPPSLEDGRDVDVLSRQEALSSSQFISGTSGKRIVPLEHLIHPERQSELAPFTPKEKPLYSFLVHFPIFSARGARLSVVDRAELVSIPAMAKWGFENSMTTFAYPRLHLTNGGTACIVVDDDLGRLEEIREDLEEAQRGLWDNSPTGTLDRTFFLVGTWKEQHVSLVFSLDFSRCGADPQGFLKRWVVPGILWKEISEAYPILSHYQELAHTQDGVRPLLGGGFFLRTQRSPLSISPRTLTLVVPLLWSPRALMFANDFAAPPSFISLVAGGDWKCEIFVQVVKMGPPALKDERNWDGPVLRNDGWLSECHPNVS